MIGRRTILMGFGGIIASPALVRAGSIMPVRGRKTVSASSTHFVTHPVLFTNKGWNRDLETQAPKVSTYLLPIYLSHAWLSSWH